MLRLTGPMLLILVSTVVVAQQDPRIGTQTSAVRIQSLIDQFRSEDDGIRSVAAVAISKFGREALPMLTTALSSEKGFSRMYVARTLKLIEPENSLAQATLIAVATDKDEKLDVRRYASFIVATTPSGVPVLLRMLNDENDVFVRRSAAFALKELFDISGHLTGGYKAVLMNALPLIVASLGDADLVVRGLAVEILVQVKGDIDVLLERSITNSPNELLVQTAKDALAQRRSGTNPSGQEITMEIKPGAEETMKKKPGFLYGPLGIIYALAIGGEPVQDFRSIPGAIGPLCLRVTVNTTTRRASSGLSKYNPYKDLR